MRQVRISRRRVRPSDSADPMTDDFEALRPADDAGATVAATLLLIDEALAVG